MTTTTTGTTPDANGSILTKHQTTSLEYRFTVPAGLVCDLQPGDYRAAVCLRYDDECGNGHNTFSATASVYGGPLFFPNPKTRAERRANAEPKIAWSCLGPMAKAAPHIPDFAEFDKWHGCSSDGPLHYPGNAVFMAGVRDCWGRAAGEESAWGYGVRFGGVPLTHRVRASFWEYLKERAGTGEFTAVAIAHEDRPGETFKFAPKFTPPGFASKWHECPWDDQTEADEWCAALNACAVEFVKIPTAWSEGKARELDTARACAIWPEATDEQLSASTEDLTAALNARLPGLMADFRRFIEGLEFVW